MAGELNELSYNNTKITFTTSVDNTARSDELEASPIYQDKMGTAYSRSKSIARAFNFAGISLILTAAAIKTGSLISNAYVLNPPSVSDVSYTLVDHSFTVVFTISNPNGYKVTYHFFLNNEEVVNEECSEEKEYTYTYDQLNKGDQGKFYIQFTNRVDYKKIIETHSFKVEE